MSAAKGRPTKYTDSTILDTLNYIQTYTEDGDMVPSVAGLSVRLCVNRSTIYEWAKHHEEFSNILDSLNACQERIALNGGLSGKLNATIVKLLLGKHDYGDRQEIDHKNNGGSFQPMSLTDFYAKSEPDPDTKP